MYITDTVTLEGPPKHICTLNMHACDTSLSCDMTVVPNIKHHATLLCRKSRNGKRSTFPTHPDLSRNRTASPLVLTRGTVAYLLTPDTATVTSQTLSS